jgi:hypothetical protein
MKLVLAVTFILVGFMFGANAFACDGSLGNWALGSHTAAPRTNNAVPQPGQANDGTR